MAFPTQTCNTVSVRLDETNYPAWVFQMQHHLRGHGLLKFVDGSHPCPPQFLIGNDGSLTTDNTRAYEKWLEQDSFVISMIITTLCVDALTLVIGCQTSMEVWLTLEERYAIVSESHIMQLKDALHDIQKGSDSIDKYLLRFKYMRDRLAVAGVEMSDQDVKFLILAGLPSEYCHTRQIIRGKRDITMNEVRSLLLSAEFEIELQNKALSLSSLTGMVAQNGISSGNSLTASCGLPTGITLINACNGQPVNHMSYIQPSASTGFLSSSQAPSVGFLGAPISSTPGDTNFQANFHGTRMMSGNGSEFQSTHQNTPLINICTTMSQAPYIMHNTPSAVGFVNLSYGASQPFIAQQQSGNHVPSASGFVAQYNNGNGNGAYPQYPNNFVPYTNGNSGSFIQNYGNNGMIKSNTNGNYSQGPVLQHNGIQQKTGSYNGNFNINNGNNVCYSDGAVQNNYPQFPNNNSRNGGNNNSDSYSKSSFSSNQNYGGPIICQICEKPGHSAYKCFQRNPQQGEATRSTIECQICKRTGHTAKTCKYRINSQNANAAIVATCTESAPTHEVRLSGSPELASAPHNNIQTQDLCSQDGYFGNPYAFQPTTPTTTEASYASISTQPNLCLALSNSNSSQSQVVTSLQVAPVSSFSIPTSPHLQQALLKRIEVLRTPRTCRNFQHLPPIAISLAVILLAVIFWPEKNKRYPPVAGTVLHQVINFPRLHHYHTELACKYKTYRILDLFKHAVYTVDPANVQYILKTNVANYGKGLYLHSILSDLMGDGIFAVDGDKWLHQRKTSGSHFSTKVLRDFSSEIFKTNGVKLAGIIYEAVTCDESMDIQDLFMKSTLDSIVKILLGIELGTMSGTNNEENIRFSNAFDDANQATLHRISDIFWKIKRFLNIGREAVLRKNIEVVDHFIYKLINRKIETLHNSENDKLYLKKRDFISRVLETSETDPKHLRDMVLNFIAAGKDTTASALSWFFYMMCKHFDIQEKIAQEVREATGLNNTSSADELAANLTEEALSKMQYLHAALTETLRLYPTVPLVT
ncbi:hypothetical protein ABKV19_024524 [Rosa sericea]